MNSSRFPATVDDALKQAGDATFLAISKGETRVIVEFKQPVRPMKLLEGIIKPLIEGGSKVKIFFDSIHDFVEATPDLPAELRDHVTLSFLGDKKDMGECDVAILFQPNNIDGNPRKIEDVEFIHYRLIWNEPRPVRQRPHFSSFCRVDEEDHSSHPIRLARWKILTPLLLITQSGRSCESQINVTRQRTRCAWQHPFTNVH